MQIRKELLYNTNQYFLDWQVEHWSITFFFIIYWFCSKNNISQCMIAKKLGLLTSTVHNAVKQFRDSGEILSKHQVCNNCLKCVTFKRWDSTAWETALYFGKTSSLNPVQCCNQKCSLKLGFARRRPRINSVQKQEEESSGRKLTWVGLKDMETCSVFREVHISAFFFLFLKNRHWI